MTPSPPRSITIHIPDMPSVGAPSSATYRERAAPGEVVYKASVRWSGSKRLANALAAVLLGAVFSYYVRSSPLMVTIVMLVPAAALLYVLTNRSEIKLSRQGVERVIGPLPWPNPRLSLPFEELTSFSIIRHARKIDDRGFDGAFDDVGLFGSREKNRSTRVVEKWELVANAQNASPVMLVKNLQRDEAYALVEPLNAGLARLKGPDRTP